MYLKHVCLYKRRSNIKNSKRRLTLNHIDAILRCDALILKMARLRFPGRPGQRIGKNYVKYVYDDVKMNMDTCFSAHSKIEINLKIFYELFGYSDEVRLLIIVEFFYLRASSAPQFSTLLSENYIIFLLITKFESI